MSVKKTLFDRHLAIDKQLVKEWGRVVSISKSKHKAATKIAVKHNLSFLTVINYGNGKGSDGYLKEILLQEFKEIV